MKSDYIKPDLIDLNDRTGHGDECRNGSGNTGGCFNGNVASGSPFNCSIGNGVIIR